MLIAPLNAFPWVLNGLAEAWVSLKRIQKLLDLPDMDPDSYYDQNLAKNPNVDVVVKHGEFTWDKALTTEEKQKLHAIRKKALKDKGRGKRSINNSDSSPEHEPDQAHQFYLSNINFTVNKGKFFGIMGTVGSGKSSIFSAILAELTKTDGEIAVSDLNAGFAIVTQQPWLQRGTIKDNILFGKNYDESKYVEVLTACCLTEDLEQLPGGDLTGVGEGGMTLSGGQKARIALARAIYQDKQIYLLDDIISAVDANVARQIFQNCIMGILRHKTRILCTHHVRYLMYADSILVMENGTITQQAASCDALQTARCHFREHLAASLKGVNFKTRPAEKIGVVGRTGAGKSSLFAALFRLSEISSGTITIDSVKISSISLTALRSRLSCIPQDPFLFSGTIRENLDPLDEYREPEIWSAINNANLIATVRRMGGLDAEVSSGGANFSAGQKQLLCLARALLHNAKILCIDEATANIDQATDRQIQCTLRSAFRKSTVITIAHRVQTVVDYDRVLVMGDGNVLEFDKPDLLLDDPSSHFYRLVHSE
ncbi:ABC transporter [Popillia japonica]|uniref:ABC transporter n=1 Tax=Popillia japonica TaxID=7064 RepID=A0AAW1MIE4_POPJA